MSELTDHIMTRQQAEEEMACLRKIFPIVRLLDRKTLAEQPCYPPWKSAHPCTSCVGREALAGKCQCTKLETMGSKHYQAIARYVEIDGEPSVIEMILPLDSGALRTLHSDEQLYADPLIGAYNRRFYEEELKHKYLNAGVAMIDLDDFKLCNDTFGHAAGDAALRLYARQRRLRAMVSQQFYDREKNDQILFGILSQVMEVHYGESSHHIPRVQQITGILLERLCQKTDRYNLTGADRRLIVTAAALHDIGRMAIDGRILNAPDPTPEQKAILRTHTILGAQMLENLAQYQDEPLVKFALQICRWHHERWDGSGFPDGLKGDSIPIAAQVVSLADAYDSLVGKGDKHLALPQAQAIAELEAGTYGAFNPLLLECLRDVKDRLAEGAGMDTPAPPPQKKDYPLTKLLLDEV